MNLIFKIAAGVILAFVILVAGCTALVAESADENDWALSDGGSITNPDAPAEEVEEEYPGETIAQQQARKSAESYLNGPSSFSRSGLIDQLKYEKFSEADATYAVDVLEVDWDAQAAKSAASYLDGPSSFSRGSLLDQLLYEGFTPAQAEYGVSQTGL